MDYKLTDKQKDLVATMLTWALDMNNDLYDEMQGVYSKKYNTENNQFALRMGTINLDGMYSEYDRQMLNFLREKYKEYKFMETIEH